MKLVPICLFTYKRLNETQQTVEALKKNYLASESELFIFSDGPKNEIDNEQIQNVREFIKSISGFKKITIYEAICNKGLANSIISGVSQILKEHDKVIVLEDDLITSPNFLDFMNQALNFYQGNKQIHSISGYTLDLPSLKNYTKDYYLGYRASSWGWGTWKEKWESVDWDVSKYKKFKRNPYRQIKFMRGGSDLPHMLSNQMQGRIDSWAIRWRFDQFIKDQLTVFPTKSKVVNIGFNKNATHTRDVKKRFITTLDKGEKRIFNFDETILINKNIIKDFRNKHSIWSRFKDKYLTK